MKRGEIYYITKKDPVTGSEMLPGRPAVIVSNDICNERSPVVEVVYLTTQEKPPMPTHVTIRSAPQISTALCEQINSVAVERVTGYCGMCTDTELQAIDRALLISLGLDSFESFKNETISKESLDIVTQLECERNIYKQLYEQLIDKITR